MLTAGRRSVPDSGKTLLSSPKRPDSVDLAFSWKGPGNFVIGVNPLEGEYDHLPPSGAEVRNSWSYASDSPCAFTYSTEPTVHVPLLLRLEEQCEQQYVKTLQERARAFVRCKTQIETAYKHPDSFTFCKVEYASSHQNVFFSTP
jgi:hypothetical protein